MENNSNKNQAKTEKFKLPVIDIFIAILLLFPFSVIFGVFTADESYYIPCSTESSSYWWSRFSLIFFSFGCILLGLASPILAYIAQKLQEKRKSQSQFLENMILIIKISITIVLIVNFGGICKAYSENEKCGKLNNLLLGFIIVYSTILGISVFCLCIFSILGLCFLCDIFVGLRNRLNRPLIH